MENKELSREQIILSAAESEFLEKGYGNAKMMSIANRAGVSHSMLHYYFRNKETLFQMVFLSKIQTILPSIEGIFDRHLPFEETVRLFVETQFDFVSNNPKLPYFILTEILSNTENRNLLFQVMSPKTTPIIKKFQDMLDQQIEQGNIRPIKFHNLIINLISMNVSTFIAIPILKDLINNNGEKIESILSERRESNVQFILNALRV